MFVNYGQKGWALMSMKNKMHCKIKCAPFNSEPMISHFELPFSHQKWFCGKKKHKTIVKCLYQKRCYAIVRFSQNPKSTQSIDPCPKL